MKPRLINVFNFKKHVNGISLRENAPVVVDPLSVHVRFGLIAAIVAVVICFNAIVCDVTSSEISFYCCSLWSKCVLCAQILRGSHNHIHWRKLLRTRRSYCIHEKGLQLTRRSNHIH